METYPTSKFLIIVALSLFSVAQLMYYAAMFYYLMEFRSIDCRWIIKLQSLVLLGHHSPWHHMWLKVVHQKTSQK